ncbi:MAG: A/G-specific adenine glycosylase [Parcubacteria group bacterium]|nr:A/G-specific adenine glycosylase [Parcubacteria group bacterium]
MKKLLSRDIARFQKIVWRYYKKHGRDLPWRNTTNPYRIVVSEIMLQQTQVKRGLVKYPSFIQSFPSFRALAEAPLSEVLKAWSGLGYNRRAVNLHRLAKIVVEDYQGKLPRDFEALKNLPGIGGATAASIRAFAFNEPTPFIETNIRAVFIHHFFKDRGTPARHTDILENVSMSYRKADDMEILELVEQTLPTENPREWYWALMDYGTHIKEIYGNPNVTAKGYKKQSKFKGSDREIRGAIVKVLIDAPKLLSEKDVIARAKKNVAGDRIKRQLLILAHEGLVACIKRGGNFLYSLPTSTITKPLVRRSS